MERVPLKTHMARDLAKMSESVTAGTDTGLPRWLDDMLKPGVGPGVFMTLKMSLFALIICLGFMLYNIEDQVSCSHRSAVPRANVLHRATPCHTVLYQVYTVTAR